MTAVDTEHCLTCGEDGHIYTDCPKAPFVSLLAGAMNVSDCTGNRESTLEFLESQAAEPTP